MDEDRDHRGRSRFTLTDTEHGRTWGVCSVVDGLFTEPARGTYELFGWVPEGAGPHGWVGPRAWLVPEDGTLDPWLLGDAETLRPLPKTGSLVLAGEDDYEGPPEGYRGPVRAHDGHRWLGSCREFTRVLPTVRALPPLVLRGLAPGDELRAVLAKGTRKALDLEEVSLEIKDDRGDPLVDCVLWAKVEAWGPSPHGIGLIDLELGRYHTLVPEHARPIWERWFTGPPEAPAAWTGMGTRERGAWLDLVQQRACRRTHHGRAAGHAYELDGRNITDEPGLYLALGEAVNGPGGYFGGCLDALDDCLGGTFGYTAPATLLWRNAGTARAHLSQRLTPNGQRYDLFAEALQVLAEGGMNVTLA
ncbi:barstar family protein [Embleya sp. NPDC050493]|uniref:barstar family protein n=1 Tax=Embleya sp. NPDC050493 TaxID=3363989 RepID=UPI0037947EDD